MPTLNIFVSFEFNKDKDLQNSFYEQARTLTQHRVRDCSLHETYPDENWKNKARKAIGRCDVVIVLIGQDTHNSPGIIVETDMARSLDKPIIQVRPQGRSYQGVTRLREPIPWKWSRINAEIDELSARRS